jgi:hypothetical protein
VTKIFFTDRPKLKALIGAKIDLLALEYLLFHLNCKVIPGVQNYLVLRSAASFFAVAACLIVCVIA